MKLLDMRVGDLNTQFTVQIKLARTGEWSYHLENGWRYLDGNLIDGIVERLERNPEVADIRVFRHETLRTR